MGRRGRDQAGRAGEWKNLKMEVTFWKRHRFRSKVAASTQARDHVERKPISLVNKHPGKKAKVSQKKSHQLLEDTNSTSARNTKEKPQGQQNLDYSHINHPVYRSSGPLAGSPSSSYGIDWTFCF